MDADFAMMLFHKAAERSCRSRFGCKRDEVGFANVDHFVKWVVGSPSTAVATGSWSKAAKLARRSFTEVVAEFSLLASHSQ
jgi:hypothetical protein